MSDLDKCHERWRWGKIILRMSNKRVELNLDIRVRIG